METIRLFSLMLLVMLASSFSGDVKPFTNGDKWIPKDFDTRNTVLLVANFSLKANPNANLKRAQDKINASMEQVMKDEYPYKFEMVEERDLNDNSKYADKDMYRFILIDANSVHTAHLAGQMEGSRGSMSTSSNVFYIYDRKLDKEYPNTGHPNGYVVPTLKPTVLTLVLYLKDIKTAQATPAKSEH